MAVSTWMDAMPAPEQVRSRIGYLMDRRGLSLRDVAQRVRESGQAPNLNASSLWRFLDGADMGYTVLQAVWNVLLDAQAIAPTDSITKAMVPARRILWANDDMTLDDLDNMFLRHDIDYAPMRDKGGRCLGSLDVKTTATALRNEAPECRVADILSRQGHLRSPAPPHSYPVKTTVQAVKTDMMDAVQRDPFRALAFVKRGKAVVGLVTPFNLLGVET